MSTKQSSVSSPAPLIWPSGRSGRAGHCPPTMQAHLHRCCSGRLSPVDVHPVQCIISCSADLAKREEWRRSMSAHHAGAPEPLLLWPTVAGRCPPSPAYHRLLRRSPDQAGGMAPLDLRPCTRIWYAATLADCRRSMCACARHAGAPAPLLWPTVADRCPSSPAYHLLLR